MYKVLPAVFEINEIEGVIDAGGVYPGLVFEHERTTQLNWKTRLYGDVALDDIICEDQK